MARPIRNNGYKFIAAFKKIVKIQKISKLSFLDLL